MPKGRGAQINTHNRFLKDTFVQEHDEGIDDHELNFPDTQYFEEHPKQIVNKIDSPDIPADYSMNPYQGCEHGCIYCYARNTHEYWGFSAGVDFESKIIVKKNAPELLKKFFQRKDHEPSPIMLAGNTDCYQPIERQLKITRQMLEVCLQYKHPISLITKNALILRDLDILKELAQDDLVHAMISITSLDETLRRKMEPRTVTGKRRLQVIEQLSAANIPVGVMVAPIIPGLNDHEIPNIIKAAAENGAHVAGYTLVRLNGAIGAIFQDWLEQEFPNKAAKVWHQIEAIHGGKVNENRFGFRMRGEGNLADSIKQLFNISVKKHLKSTSNFTFNTTVFKKNYKNQLKLFK